MFSDFLDFMEKESNTKIKSLKVDGGATANKLLMQFQSDILATKIMLPKCLETTALGVAYLAGLATGYYKDLDEIKSVHYYQAVYEPHMPQEEIDELYSGWKKAVEATRIFK